jgi:hypothetical protein
MGVYQPLLCGLNLVLLCSSTALLYLGSVLVNFYLLPSLWLYSRSATLVILPYALSVRAWSKKKLFHDREVGSKSLRKLGGWQISRYEEKKNLKKSKINQKSKIKYWGAKNPLAKQVSLLVECYYFCFQQLLCCPQPDHRHRFPPFLLLHLRLCGGGIKVSGGPGGVRWSDGSPLRAAARIHLHHGGAEE